MSTLTALMPYYNHRRFVSRALDGVLAQTRPADRIILLDDGSTDGGREELERAARLNDRVTLLTNPQNLGVVATVERLLAEATSDYVYSFAADDVIHPDLFRDSMALLEAHPTAALCSTLSRLIDVDGRDLGVFRSPLVSGKPVFISPDEARSAWRSHRTWVIGNTAIYRRQALLDAGGLRPDLGSFADGFLSLLLSLVHGCCFIPRPLGSWRQMDTGFAASHDEAELYEKAASVMREEFSDVFDEESIELWEKRCWAEARLSTGPRYRWALGRVRFTLREGLPMSDLLLDAYRWRVILLRDARSRSRRHA